MWDVLKEVEKRVVPALIGAMFGYGFAVYAQKQEAGARREVLLQLLEKELHEIAPTLDPYNVSKAFYRDPIRISSPTRLLDRGTLRFRRDGRLIELLLNLNVAISRHNDFVEMTNLAQATTTVPDNVHRQWYADIQRHVAAVTSVRDEILKEIKRAP